MGEEIQISLNAELETLAIVRTMIHEACQAVKIDDEICFDIKLAVDEAITNIIEHGYKGVQTGSIIFFLQYDANKFVVKLTDSGRTFEPRKPDLPDAEAILNSGSLGGLGLSFIYQAMDSVTYETDGDNNTLTMVKRLKVPDSI